MEDSVMDIVMQSAHCTPPHAGGVILSGKVMRQNEQFLKTYDW